jgi:hypothetical protein
MVLSKARALPFDLAIFVGLTDALDGVTILRLFDGR